MADSARAYGQVIAPAAGAAIATIAAGSLPRGFYEVQVIADYGTTPSTIDNMELRVGGVSWLRLRVANVANPSRFWNRFPRIFLNGSQALTVNAIAAGAAGTIFVAIIVATRYVKRT